MSNIYYWDYNISDWENIIKAYFRSLLVRELFIVIKNIWGGEMNGIKRAIRKN